MVMRCKGKAEKGEESGKELCGRGKGWEEGSNEREWQGKCGNVAGKERGEKMEPIHLGPPSSYSPSPCLPVYLRLYICLFLCLSVFVCLSTALE